MLSVFSAVPRINEVLHLSDLIRQKFIGHKSSCLLFKENFVVVICTEDEVESYFESFEVNYFESS